MPRMQEENSNRGTSMTSTVHNSHLKEIKEKK